MKKNTKYILLLCGALVGLASCAPVIQPNLSSSDFLVAGDKVPGTIELFVSEEFRSYAAEKTDVSEMKNWHFKLGAAAVDAFRFSLESRFEKVSVKLGQPRFPSGSKAIFYAAVRPSFTGFEAHDPIILKFENYRVKIAFLVTVFNAQGKEIFSQTYTGEGTKQGSIGYEDPGHSAYPIATQNAIKDAVDKFVNDLVGTVIAGKQIEQITQQTEQSEEIQKLRSNTETTVPIKEKSEPQKEQKLASISQNVSITKVTLREKPIEISNEMKIAYMLAEYDFFDRSMNPQGSFKSDFVDNNDGTVTDRATGLMWQKSGSSNSTDNRSAKEYVKELNRQRFADHSDWRMPTIEELASLLTRRRTNGVYMASIFDSHQTSCWSADKGDSGRDQLEGVWVVNFNQGQILQGTFLIRHTVQSSWGAFAGKNNLNYVKAVRLAE